MKIKNLTRCLILILILSFYGCAGNTATYRGNDYLAKEAGWIKEGKPLIFDGRSWYPTEYIENHLDNEMDYIDQFQKVPFYVERRQIRPFDRIYTKFDYHKYRLFLEKKGYDFDRN